MAKIRIYDTMIWLRSLKRAGIIEFTHNQLTKMGIENRACLRSAISSGFVLAVSCSPIRNQHTWRINEVRIMKNNKRKVYTGEWE